MEKYMSKTEPNMLPALEKDIETAQLWESRGVQSLETYQVRVESLDRDTLMQKYLDVYQESEELGDRCPNVTDAEHNHLVMLYKVLGILDTEVNRRNRSKE